MKNSRFSFFLLLMVLVAALLAAKAQNCGPSPCISIVNHTGPNAHCSGPMDIRNAGNRAARVTIIRYIDNKEDRYPVEVPARTQTFLGCSIEQGSAVQGMHNVRYVVGPVQWH